MEKESRDSKILLFTILKSYLVPKVKKLPFLSLEFVMSVIGYSTINFAIMNEKEFESTSSGTVRRLLDNLLQKASPTINFLN